VSYYGSGSAVTVDLSKQATVTNGVFTGGEAGIGGDAAGDFISGFENIKGSAWNDTLTGSTGANIIEGGLGTDTLEGKGGNDTYVYNQDVEGGDVIVDFNAGDKFRIDKTGFGNLDNEVAGSSIPIGDFWFVFGDGVSATGNTGHGQFIYDTATNTLYWDADSVAGGSVVVATLGTEYTLKSSDFVLV
jgi:Ca2+-binding RTX toxin-like protein